MPESELHFLLQCEAYENERAAWLSSPTMPGDFITLPPDEKLKKVLNDDKNVKKTAQYIIDIYDKRSKVVSILPSTNQERILVRAECVRCSWVLLRNEVSTIFGIIFLSFLLFS